MALLVLGINHRTASVETRERVAFPDREQASALSSALQLPGVVEIALLSTCNRTELYVSHEDVSVESLVEWWGPGWMWIRKAFGTISASVMARRRSGM